jgi:hypothetical protein
LQSEELTEGSATRHWAEPPTDEPSALPHELTGLSDEKLMRLLSEYASWESRAAVLASEAEVKIARTTRRMEVIKAVQMASSMKKVTEARADALISVEYTEAANQLLIFEEEKKLHGIQRDAMERYGKVVSRELTRRTSAEPMIRRNDRMNP